MPKKLGSMIAAAELLTLASPTGVGDATSSRLGYDGPGALPTYGAYFRAFVVLDARDEFDRRQAQTDVENEVGRKTATTTTVTITWAADHAPTWFAFHVQIKRPGSTVWSAWQSQVNTNGTMFTPDVGPGTYSFRGE